MNRENIDELFREGLNPEEDPVAFNPADWSKLAQRLDRHEKWNSASFLLKTFGGIAALFLLFFSIWLMLPEKQEPPVQQHSEVQKKDQKIQDEQNEPPLSKEMKKDSNAGSDIHPSLVFTEPAREHPSKVAPRKELTEKAAPDPDSVRMADQKTRKPVMESVTIPDRQIISQPDTVKLPERLTPPTDEAPLITSGEMPEKLIMPERERLRVALSILVAPAYNGVNNLSNTKIGSDVGLLLTLGLTKTWSFSTGAVYAKKFYDMGYSSNYDPPSGNGGYSPQSVDADCRVLDIPLNLNYTFFNKGKTAISLGTGISSYFMLKENYRFIYANESRNRDIELVNENKHWLSVLNLQANYERRLNSKISISFQPYLKLPMRDIGYAKVRLQSFGMALNATWNL